jgi:iron complex transport system ATP-binding protein
MEPILSFEDVGFRYDLLWAVRGVDLTVFPGQVTGVFGPNGSGKTTLLKLAHGILTPQEGRVRVKGKEVGGFSRSSLARELAMVSQESHFRFSFSSLEVVLMGRFPHLRRFQFEGERDVDAAREAMIATRCLELADRGIHELSGGEKQRVLIARALAQEPSLVLLDEPTAFLDLRYKREIFQLIASLTRDRGCSAVVVTHDMDLAAQYCDRMILIRDGQVYAEGPPLEVVTDANVEAVFGCPVVVDQNPVTNTPRVSLLR